MHQIEFTLRTSTTSHFVQSARRLWNGNQLLLSLVFGCNLISREQYQYAFEKRFQFLPIHSDQFEHFEFIFASRNVKALTIWYLPCNTWRCAFSKNKTCTKFWTRKHINAKKYNPVERLHKTKIKYPKRRLSFLNKHPNVHYFRWSNKRK